MISSVHIKHKKRSIKGIYLCTVTKQTKYKKDYPMPNPAQRYMKMFIAASQTATRAQPRGRSAGTSESGAIYLSSGTRNPVPCGIGCMPPYESFRVELSTLPGFCFLLPFVFNFRFRSALWESVEVQPQREVIGWVMAEALRAPVLLHCARRLISLRSLKRKENLVPSSMSIGGAIVNLLAKNGRGFSFSLKIKATFPC